MYSKGEGVGGGGVVGARECFERVIACDIDLIISGPPLAYAPFFTVRFITIYTYSLIKFRMKNGVYYMHYIHTKFSQKKTSRNWMHKMNQYRYLRCKPKTS